LDYASIYFSSTPSGKGFPIILKYLTSTCLLDSVCKRSVISADLVPNAKLTPSQYSLHAANKASLDVVGDSVISFVIDGQHFEADVSVSAKVDDFLLESDWLEKLGAKWDFASGTVTLGDQCIKVHRGHEQAFVVTLL